MDNAQSTNLSIKCSLCHLVQTKLIIRDGEHYSLCQKCFRALQNSPSRGQERRQNKLKNVHALRREKRRELINKLRKKQSKPRQQCEISDKKRENWQQQMQNDIFQGLEAPSTQDGEVKFLQFYSLLEGILNE